MANRVRPARSKPTPEQEEMVKVADEGAATKQAVAGAQAAAQNLAAGQQGPTAGPTEIELDGQSVGGRRSAHPEARPSSDRAHGAVVTNANPMTSGQHKQAEEAANRSGEGSDGAVDRANASAGQQDDATAAATHGSVNQGSGQRSVRNKRN